MIKCLKIPGPIDGGWSEWIWPADKCFPKSDSHPLKVTQSGQRTCTRPEPQHGGLNCSGEETGETRQCYYYYDPEQGQWKNQGI